MSTKLINELTSLNVTPAVDDLLLIKDTSADLTKKITVGDLMSYASDGGLDSSAVVSLIDSDYVQARQVDIYRDEAFVTGIVDSDYVQARVTLLGDTGLDSAAVITLIDSSYIQSQQIVYGDADVITLVDSAYVALRAPAGGSANITDSDTAVLISGSVTIDSDLTVAGAINNVTIGDGNLQDSAINNIGYGINVFGALTTGSNNIVVGYNTASTLTSGNNNIVIGVNTNTTTGTTSNEIVIGNDSNNRLKIPGLGYEVFDSAGSLIFELNGTRVMRLDASGNLAIAGTISESQTL